MVEISGLILAIVGIAFAFEAPRAAFLGLFGFCKNKQHRVTRPPIGHVPMRVPTSEPEIFGATQSGRHPFFIEEPHSSLGEAKRISKSEGKPIFLIIYDEGHPSKSKLYYSLGCFMDYFTTKRLVQDHFITALVPNTDEDAASLIPPDDPLENCLWVVLDPSGGIIRREGVYANPDEGLKRVRTVVSTLADA